MHYIKKKNYTYGRCRLLYLLLFFCLALANPFNRAKAQLLYQYVDSVESGGSGLRLVFYSQDVSHYVPHIVSRYSVSEWQHRNVWGLDKSLQAPLLLLNDAQDDGSGGAAPLPSNYIVASMAPLNMSYYVSPAIERYAHLFRHEYTHIVMTDRPNSRDRMFRNICGSKVVADSDNPMSMVMSYLTTPRWYAPRWYHEGIACFMETWLSDGVGRALGGYDEMYFRSLVADSARMSTVVGLESEGTTKDFQSGANAYLYGTRFVNYLVMQYGIDKVLAFYNRTEDSKTFFSKQFSKVFGKPLRDVWDDWQQYEVKHQNENLDVIAQYPLTPLRPIIDKAVGSSSGFMVDEQEGVAYAAVNGPGDCAHIEKITLATGQRERLTSIDGPTLYQCAYLAYDSKRHRLFWTDRNSSWRGLRWMTVGKGNGDDNGQLHFQRVYDIVYDNAKDRLYGLSTFDGVTHIVYYDSELQSRKVLYSFRFGVSVTDLSVSPDGKKMAMTMVGEKGENQLILFDIEDLENAAFDYRVVASLDDSNLSQFRFSPDGSRLVGSSYYTGVSNIWDVEIESGEMRLLSNVKTGLFAPVITQNGDSILALYFNKDGMQPVMMPLQPIDDCNAVTFLGQKAFDANPQLATLGQTGLKPQTRSFSDVYNAIRPYYPVREMAFQGSHPNITGFADSEAWNNVVPVIGWRFAFSDPLELSKLDVSLGVSPWSHNKWKNRIHASVEWRYMYWTAQAHWNKTNFYDLFGPTLRSRKGYEFGLEYSRSYTYLLPFQWNWSLGVNAYGDMDALPLYQNVSVDDGIKSFQTMHGNIGMSKTRTTLGGTTPEMGYVADLSTYNVLADGKIEPSLTLRYDKGFLLPIARNTSFWLRNAVGQHFGNGNNAFAYDYFGGFRNNYVDNGSIYGYRSVYAMPGASIDRISAQSFVKSTAELNLKPWRFRNMGLLCLYPTYAQLSCFAMDLMANPWGSKSFANHVSIGTQLNVEVMLFNYMATTWSFGYGHCFSPKIADSPRSEGQWLFTINIH